MVQQPVREGVVVAVKMKKQMSCLICKKELYSSLGEGCKMCGMVLDEKNKENKFCCKICMRKYSTINKMKGGKRKNE